jgi:hypothetical protein
MQVTNCSVCATLAGAQGMRICSFHQAGTCFFSFDQRRFHREKKISPGTEEVTMLRKWVLAALAVLMLPLASAQAGVRIGIGIGLPIYRPYYRPYYYRPAVGVYLAPAPVYVAPPVYVVPAPAPVYVQPAPVPVSPPPAVYPAPRS